MIAFDNGPADGDYVRYIDALMASAAVAAAAAVARPDAMATGLVGASTSTTRTPVARRPDGERARDTGFAAPPTASPAVATASAIASALMSGQVGARAALGTTAALLALAVIGIGALLAFAGLLWHPLNLAVVVAAIAIVPWALRTLGAALRVPRR